MKPDIKKIKTNIYNIQTIKDLREVISEYSGDYSIQFEVGDLDDVLSREDQNDYDVVDECKCHNIQIVDYSEAINFKSLTIKIFND